MMTALAASVLASPAGADTAHDAACTAALTEAQTLQSDIGVWRAKVRVLASRRTDKHSPAVAADLESMAKEHRIEELALNKRLSVAVSGQFALHQGGVCSQDADTRAALAEATRFMNMPDHPTQAPL